jgi:hypothetical protein
MEAQQSYGSNFESPVKTGEKLPDLQLPDSLSLQPGLFRLATREENYRRGYFLQT